MSESEDTSDLMNEIFPDRESGEKDIPIKLNRDIKFESDSDNPDSESEEYVLNPIKTKKQTSLSKDSSISMNLNEEITSPYDAILEFYKLKEKFENDMNINKRKIINNPTLSKKEKRSEFLKLMPKCVNCKRPSKKGTIFSIVYHSADENNGEYRSFKAICGDLANPCNLNIEVNVGGKQRLDEELNNIRNEINEAKKKIIDYKNKLLFGLITTEEALENFDNNKEYIVELTSIYEKYLEMWNKEVDNPEKKLELDETLVQSYETINTIKDCIRKMNKNNDSQFAVEAALIYHTTLQPLLNKIRHLKYEENMVFYDDNKCHLIQRKYKTDDILVTGYASKVISYDVGLKAMSFKKKKIQLDIESDSSEKQPGQKELTIKITKPLEIVDEPIIGQGLDGIDWSNEEYKNLWNRLPTQLRNVFKSNIDWMKEFMYKCVNERINHGPQWNGCRLTAPPNLIIPPRQMENGEYDFGVSIYNKVFNRLPKSSQSTYFTLYREDPQTKEKNYGMLIETMNRLVEQEVNFGRGYF